MNRCNESWKFFSCQVPSCLPSDDVDLKPVIANLNAIASKIDSIKWKLESKQTSKDLKGIGVPSRETMKRENAWELYTPPPLPELLPSTSTIIPSPSKPVREKKTIKERESHGIRGTVPEQDWLVADRTCSEARDKQSCSAIKITGISKDVWCEWRPENEDERWGGVALNIKRCRATRPESTMLKSITEQQEELRARGASTDEIMAWIQSVRNKLK